MSEPNEPHEGQPGSWQPGWIPPQGGYSNTGAGTGWGPGWGTGWMPPPPPPRRRRGIPLALSAVLLVGGGAAGAAIGHAAWQTPSSTNASAGTSAPPNNQGDTELPNSGGGGFLGGNGSGGDGSGSSGLGGNGLGGDGSGANGSGGSGSEGGPLGGNGSAGGGTSGNSAGGSGGPSDVGSIAAKVNPALVDINGTFGYQNAQGAGTGIVLTSNGEIITNNHVIDGATSLSVTDVGNGKTYKATVVGYDNSHDLAVLQLKNASGLTTAKLADSSKAGVGESVVAIGNAGGTGGTPTSAGGSITALNQSITANDELGGTSEQLTGLIEVNANVQAGDSGGSLVNGSGKVIGIDTAASDQFSIQGSSGGQGYAIPINQAISTAKKIESGKATSTIHVGATAFLGVSLAAGDENQQGAGGTGGSDGSGGFGTGGSAVSGAQISDVLTGGTAAKVGLAAGDIITSLGGHAVSSPTALSDLMAGHHPGDKVTLGWVDSAGTSHTATVELGSGPPA